MDPLNNSQPAMGIPLINHETSALFTYRGRKCVMVRIGEEYQLFAQYEPTYGERCRAFFTHLQEKISSATHKIFQNFSEIISQTTKKILSVARAIWNSERLRIFLGICAIISVIAIAILGIASPFLLLASYPIAGLSKEAFTAMVIAAGVIIFPSSMGLAAFAFSGFKW